MQSMSPTSAREGTRPLLTVAARSIAAATGTCPDDLIRDEALGHFGEGVRQYLTIRTGSVSRALRAWHRVRVLSAEELLSAPPGPRARLYRLAREAALRDGPPELGAELPWRRPRGEVTDVVIDQMRRGLTEDEAELLELRHARELGPEEIAYVVDRPVDEVLAALDEAAMRAEELAADSPAPLRALLLQAFALSPGADAETGWERGAEALPAGTVIGQRYAVQQRVGTGAFGDVYRARDTEVPGHVVALKVLHRSAQTVEARASALRELHLIASVFHPSVVQFKDHGWYEGRLWFVMPWYDGETLEERIRQKPLGRGEARRIFEPLARALAAIHAAGIRHQDVKPDNIFLARIPGFGGRNGGDQVLPVLLDLGVAAKEAEMVVAGTPTYFAPEVAAQFAKTASRPSIGPKADVFALALSLRNALEPDTQPDVPGGAIEAFIEDRSKALPLMPKSRGLRFLEPALRRWMSLDPDERPTADELAGELAVLTRPEERRRKLAAVARWLVPAAVVVLAMFGVVVNGLHARVQQQHHLAERAQRAEAGLRQDLHISKAQRHALEARMRAADREYERSKMSRDQLARGLAQAQSDQDVLQGQLKDLRGRRDRLQKELAQQQQQLDQSNQQLASTRGDLTAARADTEKAAARGQRLQGQIEQLRGRLGDLQDRVTALDGQLDATQGRLEAEQAKSAKLARELNAAALARARAQAELGRLRAEPAAGEADGDANGDNDGNTDTEPAVPATAPPAPPSS